MLLEGDHKTLINESERRAKMIFVSAQDIVTFTNDSFDANVAGSLKMFTSDVMKTRNVHAER